MYFVKFDNGTYKIEPAIPPFIKEEEEREKYLAKTKEKKRENGYELIEEVIFQEIAPQELEEKFKREKEETEKEIKRLWQKIVVPYLGKKLERGDNVLWEIKRHFVTRTKLEVIAEIDNLYNVSKEDITNFAKEVERYSRDNQKYIYLGNERIEVEANCNDYDEDVEVESIFYGIDVLQPIYPDEKSIEKLAMQKTIYKHIGKAFRFDCEAVKDYIEGDLTFKGLIKKIDPRTERSC